ncbi:MAG: C25 family cysteine peptidase, partial [Candidatus Thorarchaeota archaeon]|nr:C25 family cysteine peptidase [Candidatus Thorarchaeota archaeon]
MKLLTNVKKSSSDIDTASREYQLGKTSRKVLSKLLVVCGKVGSENIANYQAKAKEIGADFIVEERRSWVFVHRGIKEHFDRDQHKGILLIGTNKEIPGTQISYQGSYAYTDWFIQDVDDDMIPDVPVGRIFGPSSTVLYHMDPNIID